MFRTSAPATCGCPNIDPPNGHTRHPLASLFYTLDARAGSVVALRARPTSTGVMEKCLVTVPAAFMHVRDNLDELGKVADDTDLLFLKGLLDSPVVTSLVKVSERAFSCRCSFLCRLCYIIILLVDREIISNTTENVGKIQRLCL